jgi:hypothetical protein
MDRQATAPAPAPVPAPASAARPRGGLYLGPIHITLALVVVALALVGSAAYIVWVVLEVDEGQLELLAYGFVVLGASFAAIAVGSLVGMWRAASRASGGRALGLAIVGGLAALAAIGCFTVSVVSALVWTS